MTTVTIPNRTIPIAGTQPPSVEWYRWMSDITRRVGGVTTALQQTSGAVSVAGTLAVTGNATIGGTLGVTGDASFANISYTGTLTGGTGVISIGSGQLNKNASGLFSLGEAVAPNVRLNVVGTGTSTTAGANTSVIRLTGNGASRDVGVVFTDGSVWNTWIGAAGSGDFYIGVSGTSSFTERFRITTDGRLYGTALHNTGTVTGTTNQYIASGTYTPTGAAGTNVGAVTPRVCQWIRVGNVVTVSGACNVDPNTAGSTADFSLTLPIASGLANAYELGGTAYGAGYTEGWAVYADTTNDRANFETASAGTTAAHEVTFHFTYVVK